VSVHANIHNEPARQIGTEFAIPANEMHAIQATIDDLANLNMASDSFWAVWRSLIQAMVDVLDRAEGEPDFEDDGTAEPVLGWQEKDSQSKVWWTDSKVDDDD
jgi:hypothetical protein